MRSWNLTRWIERIVGVGWVLDLNILLFEFVIIQRLVAKVADSSVSLETVIFSQKNIGLPK